jgi:hypothetical protein
MLGRNKKKAHLPKKSRPPSKIKLRKHLNADALFTAIRREFEKIPEFRTGDVGIGIPDALMSAFAMFSLKDPSLFQFDSRREDLAEYQNLKSIYGIRNIPSDSRMREIGDEIDPKKYLSPIFKVPFQHLQRGKVLEQMVFYKECPPFPFSSPFSNGVPLAEADGIYPGLDELLQDIGVL